MIIFPKAKINLGLRVVNKREDNFHNIETLILSLPELTDILEIVESDTLSLKLYGREIESDKAIGKDIGENLVVKAYNLLAKEYSLPGAEIHLYKNIPSGAGLGGGSSDGAATLILLNTLYKLGLDKKQLLHYGAKIGSDCPYFILAMLEEKGSNAPYFVTGRGERLESFPIEGLENYRVKLYPNNFFISTAEAYSAISSQLTKINTPPRVPLRELLKLDPREWRELLHNDFEQFAFERYPELALEKERLYREGATYVSMSGSGSALYALYPIG